MESVKGTENSSKSALIKSQVGRRAALKLDQMKESEKIPFAAVLARYE